MNDAVRSAIVRQGLLNFEAGNFRWTDIVPMVKLATLLDSFEFEATPSEVKSLAKFEAASEKLKFSLC